MRECEHLLDRVYIMDYQLETRNGNGMSMRGDEYQ